jgi:hypothetical protein
MLLQPAATSKEVLGMDTTVRGLEGDNKRMNHLKNANWQQSEEQDVKLSVSELLHG